jgi:hypothetical protein
MSIARFSRDAAATSAIAMACLVVDAMVSSWMHHRSPTHGLLFSCVAAGAGCGVFVAALRVSVAAVDRVTVPGADPRIVQRTSRRVWVVLLPAIVVFVVAVWAARRGEDEAALIIWATVVFWSASHLVAKATSRRLQWLSTYRPAALEPNEHRVATGLARCSYGSARGIEGTLTLTERRLVFTEGTRCIELGGSSVATARRMRSPASGIVLSAEGGRVALHLADPDHWLTLLATARGR